MGAVRSLNTTLDFSKTIDVDNANVNMILENGKWKKWKDSLVLYVSPHRIVYIYRDIFKTVHLVSYEGYPEWEKDPYKATINARKEELTLPLGEDLNLLGYLNEFI